MRPVGTELCCVRTDGRTGRHEEANSGFSQFRRSNLRTFAVTSATHRPHCHETTNILIRTHFQCYNSVDFVKPLIFNKDNYTACQSRFGGFRCRFVNLLAPELFF